MSLFLYRCKKKMLERKCKKIITVDTVYRGKGNRQGRQNYYFSFYLLVSTPALDLAERTVSFINLG